MRNWKYGISFAEQSPMTAPLPLAGDLFENMDTALRLGYDGIEFHTRENAPLDLARMAAHPCGIAMLVTGRVFTQGGLSLLDEDPAPCVAAMKTYLDKAAELQAGIVLGWAKGNIPQGGDRELYLNKLGTQLRILNDYGKAVGAPIVIEVINRYETNIFNTAAETLAFIEKHDLDNCYVHLDTFHMNIEETDPCEAIRLCGSRLGYFHAADNTRLYPGSGQLNFGKMFDALEEIGYTGWVTVECIPQPDRETAAARAIAHLRQCEG